MTQPGLNFEQKPRRGVRVTLVEKLADYFTARPGVWIQARELEFAGRQAWRTRVSDLRKMPFNLNIENRIRHWHDPLRIRPSFTISEYRYVPPAEKTCDEEATSV
jgi:hypothetical protein